MRFSFLAPALLSLASFISFASADDFVSVAKCKNERSVLGYDMGGYSPEKPAGEFMVEEDLMTLELFLDRKNPTNAKMDVTVTAKDRETGETKTRSSHSPNFNVAPGSVVMPQGTIHTVSFACGTHDGREVLSTFWDGNRVMVLMCVDADGEVVFNFQCKVTGLEDLFGTQKPTEKKNP